MNHFTFIGSNAGKTLVAGLALMSMSLCATAQNRQSVEHIADPLQMKLGLDQRIRQANDSLEIPQPSKAAALKAMKRAASTGETIYLDSTVTKNADGTNEKKYVCYYDENGKEKSSISYVWDTDNDNWIGSTKYEYEYAYNDNGNRTHYAYAVYDWNADSNNWVGINKYEYNYDGEGRETLYARYDWDSTNAIWVYNFKYEGYEYDLYGEKIQYTDYSWNVYSNAFDETVYTCELTYNDDGRLTQSIKKRNGSEDTKTTIEYDEEGNQILFDLSEWDTTNKEWRIRFRQENNYETYNGVTCVTLRIRKNNPYSDVWWIYKYEYGYEEIGDSVYQTSAVIYEWDEDNSVFVKKSKYEYDYDKVGNVTTSIYYDWDAESNDWTHTYGYEYTYDENGYVTSESYYLYNGSDEKTLEGITTYYYSTSNTGDNTGITNSIIDNGGTVRIYDIQGRERTTLGEGINIVKANGKTMKVVKGR